MDDITFVIMFWLVVLVLLVLCELYSKLAR